MRDRRGRRTNERLGESEDAEVLSFADRPSIVRIPSRSGLRGPVRSRGGSDGRGNDDEPGLPVRYESSCLEGGPRSTLNGRGASRRASKRPMGWDGTRGEDANDGGDDDDDDQGACVIIYSV